MRFETIAIHTEERSSGMKAVITLWLMCCPKGLTSE